MAPVAPRSAGHMCDSRTWRPHAAFLTLLAEGKAAGLTLADMEEIAKRFGITVVQEGQLLTNSFEALNTQMQDAIAAVTTFGRTLDGLRPQTSIDQKLAGHTGPLATLQLDQQHAEKLFPTKAGWLATLDLTTKAGQDAFRQFLKDEQETFKAGFFLQHPSAVLVS